MAFFGAQTASVSGILSAALRVFLPFSCGYFLSYVYRTVNAVIAGDLVQDIPLDAAQLGMMTSAYFLAFAFSQLPLGVLLDRFGPRRVEACLLMVAALGALIFAWAHNAQHLIAGRALIGLGVSACLMGALKANVLWFPHNRLPMINGLTISAGGVGALAATAPIELVLQIADWRQIFLVLAALTLALAALLVLVVPEKRAHSHPMPIWSQLAGIGHIFRSWRFWRIMPLNMTSQAALMAAQGLWLGPWLRDVQGFDRFQASEFLLLSALGMAVGALSMGVIAHRLERFGIRPFTVQLIGMIAFMIVQAMLLIDIGSALPLVFLAFGFFGMSGSLLYAILSLEFPAALAGRVVTGINFLSFVSAFTFQSGIGVILDLSGGPAEGGYGLAFGAVLLCQILGLAWLACTWRKGRADA